MEDDKKWIDARFGERWVEHALKHHSHEVTARVAVVNGREKIRLQEALARILEKCPDNPNVPFTYEVRKIVKEALGLPLPIITDYK